MEKIDTEKYMDSIMNSTKFQKYIENLLNCHKNKSYCGSGQTLFNVIIIIIILILIIIFILKYY